MVLNVGNQQRSRQKPKCKGIQFVVVIVQPVEKIVVREDVQPPLQEIHIVKPRKLDNHHVYNIRKSRVDRKTREELVKCIVAKHLKGKILAWSERINKDLAMLRSKADV